MNKDLINQIIIKDLGIQNYEQIWKKMRDFTDQRTENTIDELWLLEHSPVFTQGLAGKAEHVLNPTHIPLVQSDRGGQVTYHGPGQLVLYPLIDLKRKSLHARQLVTQLEQMVITYLRAHQIESHSQCDAPGVYVQNEKISSIGLRIRKGCSCHGVALNIDMDLTPFKAINPLWF